MSLRMVLGGSGSGKSHWLYCHVIDEAMRHPEKNYIVIVPEQFTMQTQKELVRLHPAHGILNIDILSFQRLAYRVFEQTGAGRETVLTETGKNLLLRRVAAGERADFSILGSKLDRPGYLSEIKSILSEFTQYEISDAELEEIIALSSEKPLLQYKLRDILRLRRAFREFQGDRFITAEEVLDVFCQAVDGSELVKRSIFVFDGFTGFTPVQQKAFRKLLSLSPELTVTVALDDRESITGNFEEHELFSMSKKMIRMLTRLAGEERTELLQPVILTGKEGRFADNEELSFLEQHLFRYGKRQVYPKRPERIFLHVAGNPRQEVEFTAGEILRLVEQEGLRYREIAVITGDLPSYANHVRHLFGQYQIPCFVDQTVQVLLSPALEFIRGAFEFLDQDFSRESVLRFIRTGFADISTEEADLLENYLIARGLRGYRAWEMDWTERTGMIDEPETALCNEIRMRFLSLAAPWTAGGRRGKAKLKEYAGQLYDLMVSCRVQEKLKRMEEQFQQDGQAEKEREYRQIYGILIGLLDEAVELLGEETVTRREFQEILEAGFSEARIGMIPPGVDQVQVGDMERTRLDQVKALFFVGLNDGWVPARENRSGLVSDLEREFLQLKGVDLAPTARDNGYIQRFYLYLMMTKPKDRLYLSFSRSDSDGAPLRPSYLIASVQKLFPLLEVMDESLQQKPLTEQVKTFKAGVPVLARLLREYREGDESYGAGKLLELFRQYREKEEYRETLDLLEEAAFLNYRTNNLDRTCAHELYGDVLAGSVTRLEQFAACAFAHFADFGLGLREREEYQVRSLDIGNIFHDALEIFAEKLMDSGYGWADVPDQVREQLAEESAKEAAEHYSSSVFFSSARAGNTMNRIRRILKRSVWALQEQVRRGSFIPEGFEVSFAQAEDLSAVNITLTDTEKMRLRGRIDRIDVCEEEEKVYVKVIDYKSGNTSFDLVSLYYGLQLQLVVYLNAAQELEQRLHPGKEIVPAGILYYRLRDPVSDGNHELTEEEISDMILKKLRPDGLVNDDPAILDKLDSQFQKDSLVIPVTRKKDGSLGAYSKVISGERFGSLSGFVQNKLGQIGHAILEGEVAAAPYRRKQETACDYCIFASLCGFDRKIPGSAMRQLAEMPDAKIWEKITEQHAAFGKEAE